ncbi:hypothetical protein A3K42_01200 [candidate division WWE3 bacterium RBG_13_37_7]|uniref:Uncharacterized protein n=1 Tax=candidate division WWE3 bacterium RBG_13_37_7 TaxID=1802609 RepID=A0A1F4U1T7_UNCKA|nr:MAG: hypothetical protein A3K42_01200 [candidate division WWE3 bacterium RBG_13_37_7]
MKRNKILAIFVCITLFGLITLGIWSGMSADIPKGVNIRRIYPFSAKVIRQESPYGVAIYYRKWKPLYIMTKSAFILSDPEARCLVFDPKKGKAEPWDCNSDTGNRVMLIYNSGVPEISPPLDDRLKTDICIRGFCGQGNEKKINLPNLSG